MKIGELIYCRRRFLFPTMPTILYPTSNIFHIKDKYTDHQRLTQTKKENPGHHFQSVRQTKTLTEKDIFVPLETRPGLKASKKISFQGIPELNIYMLVSLHFTWMTAEYRLAAVCIRHVQECNRNQRPRHISQINMSKERPQGG